MVVNGLIDISFTAIVGKMATVVFVDEVPLFRGLSLKKLRYVLKKYQPDTVAVFAKDAMDISPLISGIAELSLPLSLLTYSLDMIHAYGEQMEISILFVPTPEMIDTLGEGIPGHVILRVSEDVFSARRKWFIGKEKKVEVVSPTLDDIFSQRGDVLYRRFWL